MCEKSVFDNVSLCKFDLRDKKLKNYMSWFSSLQLLFDFTWHFLLLRFEVLLSYSRFDEMPSTLVSSDSFSYAQSAFVLTLWDNK